MKNVLKQVEILSREALPDSVDGFLRELGESALIRVPGRNSKTCRMVVTLLHGNEPSGVIAIHRFLREKVLGEGFMPRTDLYFCIASIELALMEPLFTRRQYSGERDLNRCFFQPSGDSPGQIAASILQSIETLRPEAIVDIHNTSGSGPSFSVCTALTRAHRALSALFTSRVVVTDLGLGALIDLSSDRLPIVTIECGGVDAKASHQVAFDGILRFAGQADLFAHLPGEELDIYHHPVRLELEENTRIAIADANDARADITLPAQIEKRNFGYVTPDIPLAWVNNAGCLKIKSAAQSLALEDYFFVRGGQLYCAHPLKLFMVTTNPVIALSDCLLYAVKEIDHNHIVDQ